MRLPSQMRGGGPRITSARLTAGVRPSAHELKKMAVRDYFNAQERGPLLPQLCNNGETLCIGDIDANSQTIAYICCPRGWECAMRNGLPDCKLPNPIDNWFKGKLGRDVFGEIMRRVNVR